MRSDAAAALEDAAVARGVVDRMEAESREGALRRSRAFMAAAFVLIGKHGQRLVQLGLVAAVERTVRRCEGLMVKAALAKLQRLRP